ncbi:MAG: bifunctional folylpolyglutamate synthase/dihydrofolate synthase [Lachnospiraceae bacterium]|nr:bifunctional folylpolyglutamate synthase/dihydrofolate synthase [Lachnospiraceae bacterium]
MEEEYQKIIQAIENKRRFGKASGREVISRFLPAMGNPDRGMKIIHIAGTNGKGSTAAGLARILQELGFRTGLFTSPHLIDYCERIQVDGQPIQKAEAAEIGRKILTREIIPDDKKREELASVEDTMFDDSLLMALLYFRKMTCDYVVLETGLGGRLDSTSGLSQNPLATVITRIGLDHMKILGNTLEEIAREKAGILRPGVPLILAENDPSAAEAILASAEEKKVPVYLSSKDKALAETIPCSLIGSYQAENMANVLTTVRVLFPEMKEEALVAAAGKAFSDIHWPGRMQVLSEDPFLLIDGAHNPQGVHALKEGLVKLYGPGPYCFVMGVLADKDYHAMIREILPMAASFRTVTVENQRALQGQELAGLIEADGVRASSYQDPAEAIGDAEKEAEEKGLKTVAFGSLYFIGEILKINAENRIRSGDQHSFSDGRRHLSVFCRYQKRLMV